MKINFHYSISFGGEININTRTNYLYFKKEPLGLILSDIPKKIKEELYFKKVISYFFVYINFSINISFSY